MNKSFSVRSRRHVYRAVAITSAITAIVRVCMSYGYMSQTFDETDHISTGMQWLARGTYNYETLHPPLARVSVALLPYLDGARSHGDTSLWEEGNDILHGQGNFWRTLTLARIGILPYFILCLWVLWIWSKRLWGDETAMWSVAFFSLLPPVIANAGLATTDMPITAMFLLVCFTIWQWLQRENYWRALALGIVLGLSFVTKFSSLLFVPAAAGVMVLFEWYYRKHQKLSPIPFRRNIKLSILVLATTCLVIWASYQFSFGPLLNHRQTVLANQWLAQHNSGTWTSQTLHSALGLSIPAPEFFNGILHLLNLNHEGHPSYFLGHSQYSSPWFFPVILGIKTPIAFLFLVILGIVVNSRRRSESKNRQRLPILISFALLLICVSSNLNFGVRHILPIYPFLAMLAALGVTWVSHKSAPYNVLTPIILTGWIVFSIFYSGKDSLAYFNEIGSPRPEYFSLDSDLDWGQDIDRLADTLRSHKIKMIAIGYHGSADLVRHNFPAFDTLRPFTKLDTGWIAISKWNLYAVDGYQWLLSKKPVAKIGSSMLLYHL
jgi:hypothetical protein